MIFLLDIIGEKYKVSKNVSTFIIMPKCGYWDTEMHLRILILLLFQAFTYNCKRTILICLLKFANYLLQDYYTYKTVI